MKVVMNAVSAKMGGAVAYLKNFLPTLARMEPRDDYIVFVHSAFARDFEGLSDNIRIETRPAAERGERHRLVFDQWTLRRFIKAERADAVFSTANFGILHPPAPQVTSVRNPVYFCREYYPHVRETEGRLAEMKVAMRRRHVALSCASSKVVVTPTAAMRDMLMDWKAVREDKCVVINHGFDLETFLAMKPEADESVEKALQKRSGETLLFYPSLYGKHKNFNTLMRAMAAMVERGMNVRLLLTCRIDASKDAYQRRTREIMAEKGVEKYVTEIGPVPYKSMPRIYAAADVILWPTFAESFGHPLLETMASRKPIVSSGLAVNREMAGDAAVYFDTFDPADMADKVEEVLEGDTASKLVEAGLRRVGDFSWQRHVEDFVKVFERLSGRADG